MDFAEINGAALRYDVAGEGARTLVLLHEMAGSLESWDAILPMLTPGRRVLRYDWRGAGMSERARGTLSMETLTDDLFALLERLGWQGDIAICGMAVGGAIALNAASRGGRVKGVVAMSAATGYEETRRPDVLAIADQIERGGMRARMEASMSATFPPELRGDEAAFQRYRARWLANDPVSYAAAYRMLAHLDMRAALSRIGCPVLVLGGEYDSMRPVSLMRQVAAQIPDARVQTVPSGHVMATQTPRVVADAILEFLNPLKL